MEGKGWVEVDVDAEGCGYWMGRVCVYRMDGWTCYSYSYGGSDGLDVFSIYTRTYDFTTRDAFSVRR